MSESESHDIPAEELPGPSETQLFSAEYKDGQLQIVEVTPFDKGERAEGSMPVLEGDETTKYVQVVNGDKSVMQLDLLNLTLVRCEDGVEAYRFVSNSEAGDVSTETITCMLPSSDTEVESENSDAYVKVDWEQGPLVFLQSEPEPTQPPPPPPKENKPAKPPKMSPTEILARAKALQKAKQQIMQAQPSVPSPTKPRLGRKRKSELPPPHELLSSPNFKLYLYSCKLCSFKCNAIKEMTQHKATDHSGGSAGSKFKRGAPASLQCAVCPYRGNVHSQLMKHIQQMHTEPVQYDNRVDLDSEEVEAADVLVCGACGFESSSRVLFRSHIELVHGAKAC